MTSTATARRPAARCKPAAPAPRKGKPAVADAARETVDDYEVIRLSPRDQATLAAALMGEMPAPDLSRLRRAMRDHARRVESR